MPATGPEMRTGRPHLTTAAPVPRGRECHVFAAVRLEYRVAFRGHRTRSSAQFLEDASISRDTQHDRPFVCAGRWRPAGTWLIARRRGSRSCDAGRPGPGADTGSSGDTHHSTTTGFQGRSETTDDFVAGKPGLGRSEGQVIGLTSGSSAH